MTNNELQADRIEFDEFIACHNVSVEIDALLQKLGVADPSGDLSQSITETIVDILHEQHDVELATRTLKT